VASTKFRVLALVLVLAGCDGVIFSKGEGEARQVSSVVRLSSDSVAVIGILDKTAVESFRSVAREGVQKVHLRSPGGDVASAIEIAREIHRRNMDVVVDGNCGSGCANYLFIAGRGKKVVNGGALLLHGGASFRPQNVLAQFPVTTARNIAVTRFYSSLSLKPFEGDAAVGSVYQQVLASLSSGAKANSSDRLEEEFYAEIGVNPILLDFSAVVAGCAGTGKVELKLEIPPKLGQDVQVNLKATSTFSGAHEVLFSPTRHDWEAAGVKGITEFREQTMITTTFQTLKTAGGRKIVTGPISKLSEKACE
jgi:hypothetical protein